MKKIHFFAVLLVITSLMSCGGQQKGQSENAEYVEVELSKDSVYSSNPYTIDDSVTVCGTRYRYLCEFMPDTSLEVITNSFGYRYYDNVLDLTIFKEGQEFYTHSFTKTSFASHIPTDKQDSYALLGFNFNYMKENDHNQFHFIATVGDPDESGMVTESFAIDISEAGAITVTPVSGAEEDVYDSQDI